MMETPSPLLEKMTLFWHDCFAIGNNRVKSPNLMAHHVRSLRSQALGNFGALLKLVAKDPALYLDLGAAANHRISPNPRLALHLMEDICLGEEGYSSVDIEEAARATTGWFVRRNRLTFVPREHDSGMKTILGRIGPWDLENMLRILLEQRATARRVVRRVFRAFVSEVDDPPDVLLTPLIDSFAGTLDLRELVEVVLRSNLFYSDLAYRKKVKSPVEFALGLINPYETTVSTTLLGRELAKLGQDLYCPPTAKGWPCGLSWLNSATLVARNRLVAALLEPSGPFGNKLHPDELRKKSPQKEKLSTLESILGVYLQKDLDAEITSQLRRAATEDDLTRVRETTLLITSLPEFQLA
jgi:uncharacterized protein (DUF1800 family)